MKQQPDLAMGARDFYRIVTRVSRNGAMPEDKRQQLFWMFTSLLLAHKVSSLERPIEYVKVFDAYSRVAVGQTVGERITEDDIKVVALNLLAVLDGRSEAEQLRRQRQKYI